MQTATPLSSKLGLGSLLSIMAGVYTIQSIIGMFTLQGLPAILRSEGVSTSHIGLFYIAMLPWALKFIWSPTVEEIRKRGANFSHHGYLILGAQLLIILLLLFFATKIALTQLWLLFSGIFLLALLSTFADITTDGLAVDQLAPHQRHIGNVMQVGGGYLGAIFGGGVFIYLNGIFDWKTALLLLIVLVGLMSLPSLKLFTSKVVVSAVKSKTRPSLRNALVKHQVRQGLVVVFLCQFGTRSVLAMMMPFLYDQGIQLESLGLLVAGGSALTGFIGVGLSAWLIKHSSAGKLLLGCLCLELLLYIGFFFYAATFLTQSQGLVVLFTLNAIVGSAKFVALYTLMMDWSYGEQAGVDFSLFQSMDMVVGILMAVICGWLISQFGYAVHYGLAILASGFAIFKLRGLLLARPFNAVSETHLA
ncbi:MULTISPECIES: MFS transporter [unclassified Agarivorans]|uniref:MFS transporter n=1 Tax=unclassified Agarivorans TaxID=2636026 RepID=UPI003D7D73E0